MVAPTMPRGTGPTNGRTRMGVETPEASPVADVRATVAVQAIACHGLPTAFTPPEAPLDPTTWSAFSVLLTEERTWGIAAAALVEGWWPSTPEQEEAAVAHEEEDAVAMLRLDRSLVDAADVFEAAGVPWRLLKGTAHARVLWDRPHLRRSSDLDVLVPRSWLDRVGVLIEHELGATRIDLEILPGLTARAGKSVTYALPNGFEIDLHCTLADGMFGARVDERDLFDDPSTLTIAGREVPAMAPEMMFLHACYHAVLRTGPARHTPHRDIAESLPRVGRELDLDRLLSGAARWGGLAVVARGVNEAAEMFALESDGPLERWAREHVPTARESRWFGYVYGESPARMYLYAASTAAALPTWNDRLYYARASLLHPDRDRPLTRLRRIASSLIRGLSSGNASTSTIIGGESHQR